MIGRELSSFLYFPLIEYAILLIIHSGRGIPTMKVNNHKLSYVASPKDTVCFCILVGWLVNPWWGIIQNNSAHFKENQTPHFIIPPIFTEVVKLGFVKANCVCYNSHQTHIGERLTVFSEKSVLLGDSILLKFNFREELLFISLKASSFLAELLNPFLTF